MHFTSRNFKKRILTSTILFTLLFLMVINNYFLSYILLVAAVLSILEFFKMNKIIQKNNIKEFILNLIFIFYIFTFCTFFLIFSFYLHLKILIFIILLVCVASDIGGFAFGKLFKGPKLTKISPKKTITGAIGSIILSSILALFLIYFVTKNIEPLAIIIGSITSAGCQLGDLFFSYLKRKSFVKDTGNTLPGHGGILDRIDGILLGLPLGFLTLVTIY